MTLIELVLGISLLSSGAIVNSHGYIEAGISTHSIQLDAPEIDLGKNIFEYETGVQYNNISLYYRHSSGITKTEQGAGLNVLGIKVRLK